MTGSKLVSSVKSWKKNNLKKNPQHSVECNCTKCTCWFHYYQRVKVFNHTQIYTLTLLFCWVQYAQRTCYLLFKSIRPALLMERKKLTKKKKRTAVHKTNPQHYHKKHTNAKSAACTHHLQTWTQLSALWGLSRRENFSRSLRSVRTSNTMPSLSFSKSCAEKYIPSSSSSSSSSISIYWKTKHKNMWYMTSLSFTDRLSLNLWRMCQNKKMHF